MDQQYSTPFIDSTKDMLSTMVGISCEVSDSKFGLPNDAISGTIFFHGECNGQVTLSFPKPTAKKIVAEMLGMDEAEMDDETLRDGVGEMANIVAGNVKAALSGTPYRFLLSLPEIHSGAVSLPAEAEKVENVLRCDLGDFSLLYWLALPS